MPCLAAGAAKRKRTRCNSEAWAVLARCVRASGRGTPASQPRSGISPHLPTYLHVPPRISPYLPVPPRISGPRRKAHSCLPARARERSSAVFDRTPLSSLDSHPSRYPRGALNTLRSPRSPALRLAYSARRQAHHGRGQPGHRRQRPRAGHLRSGALCSCSPARALEREVERRHFLG